jgi:hypothetical protein
MSNRTSNHIYIRVGDPVYGGPTSLISDLGTERHRVGAIAYQLTDTHLLLGGSLTSPQDRKTIKAYDPAQSVTIAKDKILTRLKGEKTRGALAVPLGAVPTDSHEDFSDFLDDAVAKLGLPLSKWELDVETVVDDIQKTLWSDVRAAKGLSRELANEA